MNTVLLSTAYFPPAVYFYHILSHPVVVIENEENFHKQTYRNRCTILGANGRLNLTIPVQHNLPKLKISELAISYHTHWNQIHFRAIESAYRNSPFFDYYIDELSIFFNGKFDSLLEFNTSILKVCLVFLKYKGKVEYSGSFNKNAGENDYRYSISPKIKNENYLFPEYHQVFIEKHGFSPNLSILDIVFNLGPDSAQYIKSIKKNGQM